MRYFVTNDDLIPLHCQPENGYTEIQAVERAQREAKECSEMFSISINETVKWFHIMDDKMHYVKQLDNAI